MQILQVIAQLYIIIGAGFLMQKKFNLDNKIFTHFATYIAMPAITFYGIYIGNFTLDSIKLPLIYILLHLIIIFLAYLYSKFTNYNFTDKSIISFLSWAGNNGNFGIPVVLFLLGEEALPMASIIMLINTVFLFGPGAYFMAREEGALKKSIIRVLKLPLLYAVILGFVFNLNNLTMPEVFLEPIKTTGFAMIPTQLIVLGTFLAGVKLTKVDWKLIIPPLFSKLILMPAIAYLLVVLFKLPLERDTYVMLLQAATPLAVFTVILSDLYNKRSHQVAMANFISLVLVIITLPALWWLIN